MNSRGYDINAPKKAANLTVNADLLEQARELKINLSRVFEDQLVEVIRKARRDAWLKENGPAIDDYNARINERDSYGDSVRRF